MLMLAKVNTNWKNNLKTKKNHWIDQSINCWTLLISNQNKLVLNSLVMVSSHHFVDIKVTISVNLILYNNKLCLSY